MSIFTAVIQIITYNFLKKRYRKECFPHSLIFLPWYSWREGEGEGIGLVLSRALTIGITFSIAPQRNGG